MASSDELREAGNVAFKNGNYRKAVELYTEAIRHSSKDFRLFCNRSAARTKLKLWTDSLSDAIEATRLKPDFPKAWYRKAEAYSGLKQWENAAENFAHCLELEQECKAALIGIREAVVTIWREIAIQHGCNESEESVRQKFKYMIMQNMFSVPFKEQEIFYAEAVRLFDPEKDPVLQLTSLANLGACLGLQNRHRDALFCLLAAYGVYVQLEQAVQLKLSNTLRIIHHNIAGAYADLELPKPGRLHIEKALKMCSSIDAKSQALVVDGILSMKEGLYNEAIEKLTESIRLRKEANLEPIAKPFGHIAWTFNLLGDNAKSLKYFQTAIDLASKAGNFAELAVFHRNCSSTYSLLRDWGSAEKCLDASLAADGSPYSRMYWHYLKGRLKASLATEFVTDGPQHEKYVLEAEKHFKSASELAKSIKRPEVEFMIVVSIGWFFIRERRIGEASTAFSNALSLGRKLNERGEELAQNLIGYAMCLYFEEDFKQAIELLLEAETIYQEIWEKLRTDELLVSLGTTPIPMLCRDLLCDAYLLSGDSCKSLEALERGRSRALVQELSKKGKFISPMSFREMHEFSVLLQSTLVFYAFNEENGLLICWIITEDCDVPLFRIVETVKDESGCFKRKATVEDASSMLRHWKDKHHRDAELFQLPDVWLSDKEAEIYYSILWAPIEKLITQDRPVIIIPEGRLWKVPFSALLDGNGDRLIQRYTLSLAPSVTCIKAIKDAINISDKPIDDVLIVGNPSMPTIPDMNCFGELKGAEEEAREIAKLLSVKAFCRSEATKAVVKQNVEGCSIVHFATHGLLRVPGQVSYLPGALVFAGAGQDGKVDSVKDCLLLAEEIQALNLSQLRLAVLSCCHTGAGDVKPEGLLGLGRAFLYAGCHCVLLTLRKVSDTETRMLMVDFYTHYRNSSDAALALRNALIGRMAAGSSPTDWAPFYILGIGR